MGLIEQLVQSTVRIETILHDGNIATGTGFIMAFLAGTDGSSIPTLISNKHVVSNSKTGVLHFTLEDKQGLPILGKHTRVKIEDFEKKWIFHPDPAVDLAAFPIGQIDNELNQQDRRIFYASISTKLIPSQKDRESLSPMEDIIMLGYPNGIWDSIHNLPVIRKGITATHCAIDLNGKPEFLTDIASFPGSSGSPVFLANINGYTNAQGGTVIGSSRIWLLGIHYAGAMHTVRGSMEIVTAANKNVPITQIPNNIGVAINSMKLHELELEVKSKLS